MIRKPNFKLNWKYALGELVLIFLGISLAIGFQNWNEQRKKEASEEVYLRELLEELKRDSTTVDRYALLSEWKYEDGKYIERFLRKELAEIDSSKLLNNIFLNGRNVQYVPYLPTYDELIATGNLNIIQNNELRSSLSNLFNYSIKNEEFYVEEFKQRKINYNNHIFKYFSAEIMSEIWAAERDEESRRKVFELKEFAAYRMDWVGFKKDKQSMYHVEICLGVDRENMSNQRYNLELVSDIIAILRAELKKKQ